MDINENFCYSDLAMKLSNTNQPVLIIGDIHGQFSRLKNLIFQKNIKDCTVICVGDFGIGFKRKHSSNVADCQDLNDFFRKQNIVFMSIRGNHDNPVYFNDPDKRIDLPCCRLLPDYHTEIINGEKFLFVGGAISIDRILRFPDISYWENETFVLDESKAVKCDVLITHSAPTWIGPIDKESLSGWIKQDPTLWEECMEERKNHNRLIELCKPSKSYHGHFHESRWADEAGCFSTILNIEEIKEHRSTI